MIPPTDSDQNPKVMLSFGEALFYADTEKGFGYNMDIILNTNAPAMIGNTGLIIDIHNLKIDLSTEENIIEADLDGRPPEFMGIYTERTDVFLPKKWFKKETGQTLAITGQQLIIGTGGISGNIALRATYATNVDNEVESYFEDYFSFVYNPTISVISPTNEEQTIGSHNELVDYINDLYTNNYNIHQLQFKYPLQVTVNSSGETLTINNVQEYNAFTSAFDPNQFMWFQLGSDDKAWRIGFDQFNISFHHGEVLESTLHAQLEIPKFESIDNPGQRAIIDLYGEWLSNEDFRLSATFLPEPLPLNLFNLLTIKFQTAEVGKQDDVFYIEADTIFAFPEGSLAHTIFQGQEIDLPAIRFYFDGRFEIIGQSSIPTNISLPLGPIDMSVTAIHLGSIQREHQGRMRKYNYIGFDGGISVDPIGLDVRGDGVKYYYTVDNDEEDENGNQLPSDSYFHISTLEVDLIIPGSSDPDDAIAIIKGSLTIPEPGVSTEYAGKISLQLPKAKIYGEANMRLDPTYPAYIIDAGVEFPKPIPLGPVGIYGFRGLLGYRYVAEKEAIGMTQDDYWYDYYMAPQRGINTDKFSGPEQTADYSDPFSVGIGASIATMDGGGKTASIRAMMLLSLPSMFAIDAGMVILSERLDIAEKDASTAPFYAFVIIGDDSLEFGAGADYQLNKSSGFFIQIQAEIKAGFFFKNQHPWYINFGTRENPITATLFNDILNLRAQSFLMLSASGIEAGARVDFDFDIVITRAWVVVEVGAQISFERPQIGGYIYVEGGAKIRFIITFSLVISLLFSVELVKPFLILAELKLKLCVKIPIIGRKCLRIKIVFKWQKNNTVDRAPIAPLTYLPIYDADYPKRVNTTDYAKGVHMLTYEVFDLTYLGVIQQTTDGNNWEPNPSDIDTIIPLDTFIDFKVEKGLIPSAISAKIGGHTGGASNYTDLIPPKKIQKGKEIRQVKHKYSIEDVSIYAHNGSSWEEYHPFKAILPQDNSVGDLRIGYWQRTSNNYDTLRLLATNPFSFLDGAEPGWFIPEQYGITPSELFCTSNLQNSDCANFLNKSLGLEYYPPNGYDFHYINGAYFTIQGEAYMDYNGNYVGDHAEITNDGNTFGYEKSLTFDNVNPLIILLPESAVKVDLKLSTHAESVKVNYYKSVISDSVYQQYELVSAVSLTQAQLNTVIPYDGTTDPDNIQPVTKIEIIPEVLNIQQIIDIRQQIEELYIDAYDVADGITTQILTGEELALLNNLTAQLEALKAEACSAIEVEEECDKDERLCDLHSSLSENFPSKYPAQIESINEISSYFNTIYTDFVDEIYNALGQQEAEAILDPHLTSYRTLLSQIIDNLEGPDAIQNYYAMRAQAQLIMDKLNQLGNCDCSGGNQGDCDDQDGIVCALYEDLNNIQVSCLVNASNIGVVQNGNNCFRNFDNLIKNFSSAHPQYDILNYLGNNHTIAYSASGDLDQYFNGNSDLTESEAIDLYNNTLIVYTQIIIDLTDNLGNCHCQNTTPEPIEICTTSLQEVCWLTREKFEFNQTIPSQDSVEEDMNAMIAGIEKTVQPVWRPNTKYYVKFRLKDEVDNGYSSPGFFDYYYGFRTVGPLGHFHNHPEVNYLPDNLEPNGINKYPITSLNKYIDYKRSYPNADGNLLNSKPLFYGQDQCKINIYFAKQHVYHMLNKWGAYSEAGLGALEGAMNIMIKDPITNIVIPYPLPENWEQNETVPETTGNGEDGMSWVSDSDPNIPHNIQVLNNFINLINENSDAIHCDIDLGNPIMPAAYAYSVTLTNLKPQKLYTALVFNAFDSNEDGLILDHIDGDGNIIYEENQKIHEFVFQTSRYNNFREQVESYMLKDYNEEGEIIDSMPSIFNHKLALTTGQIDNLFDLFDYDSTNSNEQLQNIAQQFHHSFDRAIEGVLGLNAFDPPTSTDFIKIIDSITNKVIAILVRNPEPFNDPKIPLEDVRGTIKILEDPNNEYSVLHSKDYSQALIMHSSKEINSNTLGIEFQYKTWNGNNYIVEDEPDVPIEEKLHTVYLENIVLNPQN